MSSTPQVINFFKKKATNSNKPKRIIRRPKPKKPRPKKGAVATHDIIDIDKNIKALFDTEYQNLKNLKQEAKCTKWIAENSDNLVERHVANNHLKNLLTQIELIESGHREAKYIHSTEGLLQEYTAILAEPIKINFMSKHIDEQKHRKQTIIIEFLNIAKNYIHVDPIVGLKKPAICDECRVELQREDDFLFVCPFCGYAIKQLASTTSYQESNRINVAQRYVYDKRSHFGDSIKKFQAKQNTTIAQIVYDDLWKKVRNHDIPTVKLTKEHIYEFLKLTNHSDHYEDITLIFCEMTKTAPPNISHLKQKLFSLFDQIDPVYERVKPPGRVNFLNGQFVLFKLLQKLKYPCREEDFYILKTRDKMLEHDQIWKRICEELTWTYIATV